MGEKRASSPTPHSEAPSTKVAAVAAVAPPTGGDAGADHKSKLKALFLAGKVGTQEAMVVKKNNGSTPHVVVRGVVASASMSKSSATPKLEVTVVAEDVYTQDAPDYVASSKSNFGFFLPTIKGTAPADDGPEGAVANKGKPGDRKTAIPRAMSFSELMKTCGSFIIATNFFTTAPGTADASGAKPKVDSDNIKVGTRVEIMGSHATLTDGGQLYLNAQRITAIGDPVPPGEETQALIKAYTNQRIAPTAALLSTVCVGGFHGVDFEGREELQEQADVFKV